MEYPGMATIDRFFAKSEKAGTGGSLNALRKPGAPYPSEEEYKALTDTLIEMSNARFDVDDFRLMTDEEIVQFLRDEAEQNGHAVIDMSNEEAA